MTQSEEIRALLKAGKALVVGAIAEVGALKITPSGCDLVELRLDSLGTDSSQLAAAVEYAKKCPLPILATARGVAEGGQCEWSIGERATAYRALLPFSAVIDIELRDFEQLADVIAEAKALGVVVVGSFHDFEKTPSLERFTEKIAGTKPDVYKFATRTDSFDDIRLHFDLIETLSPNLVSVMGMGPLGAAARPLMAKAGSLLNYGFLGETPTAPDQWPARLLKEALGV